MPGDCQNLGGGAQAYPSHRDKKLGGAIAPLAPPPAPAPLAVHPRRSCFRKFYMFAPRQALLIVCDGLSRFQEWVSLGYL